MKRLILHIGCQKTGTTAIQRFLYGNPALLKSHDIYYPQFGIRGFGHHEIGGPISRMKSPTYRRRHNEVVEAARQGLLDEIQDNDSLIVISSESFQNCDPGLIGQLFAGYQVQVVVYLREQVGFLASAYAQKVQASDYSGSLEEFCQTSRLPGYQRFVESWEKEFGPRVGARIYARNELVQGDVLIDFCETFLRIPGDAVNELRTRNDPNPTLTQDLVEFKLRVNQTCALSPDNAELLFKGLAELSKTDTSGRIHVPPDLVRRITRQYQKSNCGLAKHYFDRENLFPPFRQAAGIPARDELETRLTHVREKLTTLHPTLAESLSSLTF